MKFMEMKIIMMMMMMIMMMMIIMEKQIRRKRKIKRKKMMMMIIIMKMKVNILMLIKIKKGKRKVKTMMKTLQKKLRKNDGISDDIMIKSFSPIKNKSAIDKMGESKGKSGSFFFYSYDRKFIIKTINNEEKETFDRILTNYYNYVKEQKKKFKNLPIIPFKINNSIL